MLSFEELYKKVAEQAARGETPDLRGISYDPNHLDCLLHPDRHAPVWMTGECSCKEDDPACSAACLLQAIVKDEAGKLVIDPDACAGCGACIEACKSGNLTASRDILPALNALKHAKGPAYVLVAPAFHGQFSVDVTPGKLRSAFKALGFDGMIEVALFADILTLKEALEFDQNINTDQDFQLTSCCCPMWIAMIRKIYHELMPHVPGAVSPMIAAGRTVKYLHPDALTIFIGPCIAKKAEAREKDIAGAVDYVLTFQEVQDIFQAAGIRPEEMDESEKDHSSRAGRIYARTGGVSEAVQTTVARLHPDRKIQVRTQKADGVAACREMIDGISKGHIDANFFEGMGCVGGCVGGPKAILNRAEGKENVDRYGDEAAYPTPLDNPYVLELLKRLGFHTVEEFLEKSDMFARNF
ncbi:[Fe-Fe] hydrogenase large subunit C-terminal domain-containing protein [Anaerolentibacter hominis]|uniref:[Fe-Fe] hydrogenase large subunit C-terminal domain-containing protein n=1 Tax=Anaerolentibacter hominis TaxID=3079009 RepID=UPI0031B84FF6